MIDALIVLKIIIFFIFLFFSLFLSLFRIDGLVFNAKNPSGISNEHCARHSDDNYVLRRISDVYSIEFVYFGITCA